MLRAQPSAPPSVVEDYYDSWLASVEHLMSDAEYRFFLGLEDGRELFMRRFWEVRAPDAKSINPARDRWRRNVEEVERQFGTMHSDRARAVLAAGKPDRVKALRGCRGPVRDLEIWTYSPWQIEAQTGREEAAGFSLVFFLTGNGPSQYYRHWSSQDGVVALIDDRAAAKPWSLERLLESAAAKSCFDLDAQESAVFAAALRNALGEDELRERVGLPIPDPGWLSLFSAELVALSTDSGLHAEAATAEISFPGSYQGATLVQGRIEVPVAALARGPDGVQLFDRLLIEGEVWAAGRMVDSFSIANDVSGGAPGDTVPLDFYRLLDPGSYALSLRVEDRGGGALLQEVRQLLVPEVREEAASRIAGQSLTQLTASRASQTTVFPSVKLLQAGTDLVVGTLQVNAVTTGHAIVRVDFLLDDTPAGSDRQPPFSAELRLGRVPRRHTVVAVAFDADDRPLARDEMVLNGGPHRFTVRLVEPAPGAGGGRVQAVVEVPEDERLDRVELFLDDTRLVTLFQPPFLHPLPQLATSRAAFVRAVACLGTGECAEDTVVLHRAPGFSGEIEVRLVELFTSVVDSDGRFARGLTAERFRVLEDGIEQSLVRFETVDSLPIHVALLMDISASMESLQETATESALRFFESVLGPRDRAALLAFHHEIMLLVPFTNDLGRLRQGLFGLTLEYATRLWDGVIYAANYFGGLEGKRALVVISDGREMGSRFSFPHALEYALSSGVAVYPIVIGGQADPLERARLRRLAEESGGTFFAIEHLAELDAVYRQLEQELRSQYLLVYQAPDGAPRDQFRAVGVEILRPDDPASGGAEAQDDALRARTIRGYYP